MRATISLLITSLLVGFFAFDSQVIASDLSLSGLNSQQQLLGKKPQCKSLCPYRGSGRREGGSI